MNAELPRGQQERQDFPRFGMIQYANRFPKETDHVRLRISGEGLDPVELDDPLANLPRIEQVSDFHCVTTWSHRSLRWSGVRFSDFYAHHIAPRLAPGSHVTTVVLRGQDGYRTTLLLEDLLAADVLLADRLDGKPLGIEHGAPLRVVAPAHYGYKSLKHVSRVEFYPHELKNKSAVLALMDHPRARVEFEERARGLPGWLLRHFYRLLIRPAEAHFAKAMTRHTEQIAQATQTLNTSPTTGDAAQR